MLSQLHNSWWKITTAILLCVVYPAGLLIKVPALPSLNETIRNLFFHVPLWFGMVLMLLVALVYSVKYLRNSKTEYDVIAVELARVSVVFGILGFLTGMLWGRFAWGNIAAFIFADTKILGAIISLLIYLAYFVLRGSIEDEEKRAKVSAVYSIFAFILLIVFIFVIPRVSATLHPGSGGNPAFGMYDLDGTMRFVFYPAIIGMTGLGIWIASVLIRLKLIRLKQLNIIEEDA
jgi:heme exporter protein C